MDRNFVMTETHIKGLWVIEWKTFEDNRGFFNKIFSADEFRSIGVKKPVMQINYSVNKKKGTIRGMHFQYPPHSEVKVVTCLKGEVFDVAVDLREGSETFLSWYGEKISPVNRKGLVIPEGFAHGFQTLVDNCELLYIHTGVYVPTSEGGFNVKDSRIAIDWPLPVTLLSEKDRNLPFVDNGYKGIVL